MRMHRLLPANSLGILRQPLLKYWNRQEHKVRDNARFKDIHKGETCLIFGNGASLKYYDFNAIPSNTVAIACSFGLVDRRLRALNVKYNVWPDSYSLYPLIYNDYVKSVQRNPMPKVVKRLISSNGAVIFFTSITNAFAFLRKPSNVQYWHHFGLRDFSSVDLAGRFSTCSCALDQMIGVARYVGFSRAILLGCDYLCTPKMEGHFYDHNLPWFGKDDAEYVQRIQKSIGDLEILVVCPKGVSSRGFPSVQFEEYFGAREVYQTNRETMDSKNIELMQKTADANLIFM